MKKIFMATILGIASASANAYVDCPLSTVKYIQADSGKVYIQLEGQDWQKLGDYSEPSMEAKLSVAMYAHASLKKVKLRFPDGHNATCSLFNESVSAIMIRVTQDN